MGHWTWRAVVGTSAHLRADLRYLLIEQGREFAAQSAISRSPASALFRYSGCLYGAERAPLFGSAMRSHCAQRFRAGNDAAASIPPCPLPALTANLLIYFRNLMVRFRSLDQIKRISAIRDGIFPLG